LARQFTLGSKERLKSRKAIERLFREGRHFNVPGFRVLYLFMSPQQQLKSSMQAGVSVSSRNFKKAVERNRIKRLLRESYRLQKNPLQTSLIETGMILQLFIIYTGKELPAYSMVYDKVNVILKKLQELVHENITSHS